MLHKTKSTLEHNHIREANLSIIIIIFLLLLQKKETKKKRPRKPTSSFRFTHKAIRHMSTKLAVRTFRGHQPHIK
jgi:hypothetical protein